MGAAPRSDLWARALLFIAPVVTVGIVAAVVAGRADAGSTEAFEYGVATLAAIAAAILGLSTRPAWPLSIGLGLGAFNGHWDTMDVPIAVDRLFIGTAIVSTLVRARVRSADGLRTHPVHWLLAVAAIYALTSAVLAGTLDFPQSRFALIDRFSLLGFVLFFVAPKAYREARDRQILLGTLVALGGYLGLTALFETVGPSALILPSYIDDPSVGIHHDRARGPFAEAAANGLSLYACAIAATIAAFTWRDRRWRTVAMVVVGLCALGILMTVTRAAWIASGAASVVTLLLVPEARRFVIPAVAAAAAGVLLAFAFIPGLQSQAEERADEDRPIWDRQNATAAAFRMLQEKPLLGFGWGRFRTDSRDYYRQTQDYPLTGQRNLHNVYLSNAVELGLIGAVLWLVAIGVALVTSMARRGPPELRFWKFGLLAMTLSYAVSALSTPLGFALPTLLLWTWAGVARGE